MALPASVSGAVRILQTLVMLYFTEKRLDLLEKAIEYMYDIAEKEVALAEILFEAHKQLRARDYEYFQKINSAPVYEQKYDCSIAFSNTDVIRDVGRRLYRNLSSTDMYSSGLRRDLIETAMAEVVDRSSAQFVKAYKNEDAFHDSSYESKYKRIADSVNQSSLYVGTSAFASIANTVSDLGSTAAESASNYLGLSVYSLGTLVGESVERSRNGYTTKEASFGPTIRNERTATGAGSQTEEQMRRTPTTLGSTPIRVDRNYTNTAESIADEVNR